MHVCNDTSRAIRPIRPAEPGERLATGSGWILIVGYGEIEVKARAPAPRNQQTIKLKDVAFIPSFFTNVVSLKRLIAGGIEWLTRQDKLMLSKQVFCLIEQKLGQWVLKYNPVQRTAATKVKRPSTFVVRFAQAQISKAPATVWHERLAHCGSEVLEHLPTSVIGARLVNGPTTTECETCGISKAYKIISWRFSPQAEELFD